MKEKIKKKKEPLPLRFIKWTLPKMEILAPQRARTWSSKLFFSTIPYPYSENELRFLESATKEPFIYKDKKVQTYEWGKKDGPVILLLHGWSGKTAQFRALVPELIKKGYRVIGMDYPGHGKSEGKRTDLVEIADAHELLFKMKTISVVDTFLCHSFGGQVSMNIVERIGLLPDKYVFLGSPWVADYIIESFAETINAQFETASAGIRGYIFKKFGKEFDEFTNIHIFDRIPKRPMLIIHDEDDTDAPVKHAYAMKEKTDHPEFVITKKLGHHKILWEADIVKKVIDYIGQPQLASM